MYGPIQPGCLASVDPMQRQLADSIVKMSPLDEIRILLATGAKANEPVTQGLRPLHYAVWQRYPEAALLLLVRGGDVNATDECGYSALHLSAEHGYADLAALLLNHGAKVDFRESTGELFPKTTVCDEPLRLAIRNKHLELARMLLDHGADPNKRYFFGSEINLVSPLDIVYMRLLLTYGADPNSRDRSGLTPLMKAARSPKGMESVLLLLSHGADVNAMTDERHDYRTVLHYAILGGNIAVVNLLIKQGAKLNYALDLGKPSPLDLAIVRGDPELVKLLLKAGSCVNACSPVLGSPVHVASSEGVPSQMEILTLLLEGGADPNLVVESDEGPPLKPALAEYLANNEKPSHQLVSLLIRHGAKVVMKSQFRHPCGILNALQHIKNNPIIFNILLDAAESFDMCMIKRNIHLLPEQKAKLLQAASTPLTLRQQSRLVLRQLLGDNLAAKVQQLYIPLELHKYLLYECS